MSIVLVPINPDQQVDGARRLSPVEQARPAADLNPVLVNRFIINIINE